jgi:hypothetical protein
MTETPHNWPAYYHDLTTHELIARTYSLRMAAKWGHALEQAERFAALEAEQNRRCVGNGEEAHRSALVEHAERGHTRPLRSWSDSMLRDELRNIARALQADDGEHYDSLMSQDRMVRNEITFRGAVSSF